MFLSAIQLPYIPGSAELRPFVAEIWITVTIVAVLIVPFFTRRSNLACGLLTLLGLIIALIGLLTVTAAGPIDGEHFRGMLVSDHLAIFWKVILLIFVIGIVLLWFACTAPDMHEGDGPEFCTLLLGATLGMSLMASTSNLLMIVLAIELASLPSYVLAGFRKTDRIGAEASLKYVLFGAASSSIMIYGLSLLYGLYGTLSFAEISGQIAAHGSGSSPLLAISMLALLVGIGFKLAMVPFHFWCPDVFEGAGIDVAAFLSVASKGAALVLLIRLLSLLSADFGDHPAAPLSALATVIGIAGALTATVGNTAAFVQNNIKRLLAYSSIAHAGYMLCALALFSIPRQSAVTTQAILVYLTIYMFMNLGAFTVAAMIFRQTGDESLGAFANLSRRAPVLAICMAACLLSLVGVPPFAGFFAKLNVMLILGHGGGWRWALVAVIGINTVLSLYYYLRVVRVMFFAESDLPGFARKILGTTISVLCVIMLLLLLIAVGPLLKITEEYGHIYVPDTAIAP